MAAAFDTKLMCHWSCCQKQQLPGKSLCKPHQEQQDQISDRIKMKQLHLIWFCATCRKTHEYYRNCCDATRLMAIEVKSIVRDKNGRIIDVAEAMPFK